MNLDSFSERYDSSAHETAQIEKIFVSEGALKLAMKHIRDKSVINLGLGNGKIAKAIAPFVSKQLVLEGSGALVDNFDFEHQNTRVLQTFFEEFSTDEKFDVILANHILEHVENPVILLKHVKKFMTDDGIILITVPNANSIHRLVGVEMNLLKSKYELNQSDLKAGHKRVYDFEGLERDVNGASLSISGSGGYNLKMVSLSQMKGWPKPLLDSIYEVSLSMPKEICSNLWCLCTNRKSNCLM